jgi:cystathionine gamma-synthase
LTALECGYPRFIPSPNIIALEKQSLAVGGEICYRFFPSRFASDHAMSFLQMQGVSLDLLKSILVEELPFRPEIRWSFSPGKKDQLNGPLKLFFQHTGEGLSSRQAESILKALPYREPDEEKVTAILSLLGKELGLGPESGQLYPSGMSAWFSLLCWIKARMPGKSVLQYGFAYIDTLALPAKMGVPQTLIDDRDPQAWEHITQLLAEGKIGAIFVEYPTNPLLLAADLPKLRELSLNNNVPLVIDDSLSSFANFDFSEMADLWLSSLTKVFNGRGNLMAGALFANPQTPWGRDFMTHSQTYPATSLHHRDLDELHQNAKNWKDRVRLSNSNADAVAAFLQDHPQVNRVYYPRVPGMDTDISEDHEAQGARNVLLPREGQGWGGLLSFSLVQGEAGSRAFYDAVDIPKGPSFGTEFPLLCPYILLAHFHELDWVREQGVDPYLLRLWVGTQPSAALIEALGRALSELD